MGNVPGAVRFTENDKLYLLKIVKNVLPSGADEWNEVCQMYMAGKKKQVAEENEAIRLSTGKKGVKTACERTVTSLRTVYKSLKAMKGPTGKLTYNLMHT